MKLLVQDRRDTSGNVQTSAKKEKWTTKHFGTWTEFASYEAANEEHIDAIPEKNQSEFYEPLTCLSKQPRRRGYFCVIIETAILQEDPAEELQLAGEIRQICGDQKNETFLFHLCARAHPGTFTGAFLFFNRAISHFHKDPLNSETYDEYAINFEGMEQVLAENPSREFDYITENERVLFASSVNQKSVKIWCQGGIHHTLPSHVWTEPKA